VNKGRLEAFSDGVIAIIMTIMVLELRPPEGTDLEDLGRVLPSFAIYALSFALLGIYWANHHHLLQRANTVNGAVLWANLHLLFWLSIVPFGTAWVGASGFASIPVASYGAVLLLAAFAYFVLVRALIRVPAQTAAIAAAVGRDTKGKLSPLLYALAIPVALLAPWLAMAMYLFVAIMWIVPDRRMERVLS
jgi:uncharacterized membrane protein